MHLSRKDGHRAADTLLSLPADPDLSNPTRHRNESPLQTIRSFQYTIDKAYDTRRRVPHQPSRASLVRNGGRGGSISPVATFGSQPYLEYRNNRLDFVSASDADLDVSDLIPHHPHYYQRSHSRLRIPINSDSSSSSGPSLLPSQSSFARIPRASSPRVLSSIATPSPQPTDDISSIMKYSEENSPVQSSAATTGGTSSSGSHHLTPPVGPLQGLAVTMPATAPPGSAPQPPAHSKSTTEYDEYEDDDEDDDEDDENLNDRKDNKGTRGMFRRWFS